MLQLSHQIIDTRGFTFIRLRCGVRRIQCQYISAGQFITFILALCTFQPEKIAHHTLVSSLINLKRNLFEDKPENRSHTKVMNLHVASWGIHPISLFLNPPPISSHTFIIMHRAQQELEL